MLLQQMVRNANAAGEDASAAKWNHEAQAARLKIERVRGLLSA